MTEPLCVADAHGVADVVPTFASAFLNAGLEKLRDSAAAVNAAGEIGATVLAHSSHSMRISMRTSEPKLAAGGTLHGTGNDLVIRLAITV